MKERPILFSGAMVRSIFAGKKTQTRRTRGLDKFNGETSQRWRLAGDTFEFDGGFEYASVPKCPYGSPGDRLWVRETHGFLETYPGQILFRADEDNCGQCPILDKGKKLWVTPKNNWRPSIHMPRWASRILLEIVSVRVERLQDIRETDAIDEGVFTLDQKAMFPDYAAEYAKWEANPEPFREGAPPLGKLPTERFRVLWESINGKGTWETNPFVWVIEFKVV